MYVSVLKKGNNHEESKYHIKQKSMLEITVQEELEKEWVIMVIIAFLMLKSVNWYTVGVETIKVQEVK